MPAISAKVIADSIAFGTRLTTLELEYPRFLLPEFNTHRVFSRNTASSRAIPAHKVRDAVKADPFVPSAFLRNKPGMQAGEPLAANDQASARAHWLSALNAALDAHKALSDLGVHKQHTNRLLEPFMFVKQVVTSTDYDNFLSQRDHPDAQPEMQALAQAIRAALDGSAPYQRDIWHEHPYHLPYVSLEELDRLCVSSKRYDNFILLNQEMPLIAAAAKAFKMTDYGFIPNTPYLAAILLSARRCATVSYTKTGQQEPLQTEALKALQLLSHNPPHWSPFEHQALAYNHKVRNSNLGFGWRQARSILKHLPSAARSFLDSLPQQQ